MALHSGPADAEGGGGFRYLELAAALLEKVLEERHELLGVAEGKKPLNVPRKERIHPLPVKARPLCTVKKGETSVRALSSICRWLLFRHITLFIGRGAGKSE
jgi:hypothetical protein